MVVWQNGNAYDYQANVETRDIIFVVVPSTTVPRADVASPNGEHSAIADTDDCGCV